MTFSLFAGARFINASVAADCTVWRMLYCKLKRLWPHTQQVGLLRLQSVLPAHKPVQRSQPPQQCLLGAIAQFEAVVEVDVV